MAARSPFAVALFRRVTAGDGEGGAAAVPIEQTLPPEVWITLPTERATSGRIRASAGRARAGPATNLEFVVIIGITRR